MVFAAKVRYAPMTCGFCSTGHHNLCPRAVRNGNGSLVLCLCDQPYCGSQVLRCLTCKNETDEEVGEDWRCIDREACADTQQKRLDANPHLRLVREVMVRVAENETAEKVVKEKAPKKETFCVHCGEPTRGGSFLPGHDARFVAEKVREVLDPENAATEESALADMKERGLSVALQGKLTKSVKLAREEAAKRAEAQQTADLKAREKAEAEANKLAKKAKDEAAESVPDTEEVTDPAAKSQSAAKKVAAKKS